MVTKSSDSCKEITEVVVLILGAVVASVGCLTRPDYNLPIFLFTLVITRYFTKSVDDSKDQFFCIILFLWSFAVDVCWLIFVYAEVWDTKEYQALAKWEDGLHTASTICMFINAGIKLAYVIFKFISDGGTLWKGFKMTYCCCFFKNEK